MRRRHRDLFCLWSMEVLVMPCRSLKAATYVRSCREPKTSQEFLARPRLRRGANGMKTTPTGSVNRNCWRLFCRFVSSDTGFTVRRHCKPRTPIGPGHRCHCGQCNVASSEDLAADQSAAGRWVTVPEADCYRSRRCTHAAQIGQVSL